MSLAIRPVSPGFGAEIRGLDLRQPIGDNLFGEVRQAWRDADGLLVIRDQGITPEQHIDFSRRFGELHAAGGNPALARYYLPGHPEIYRVSNKVVDGEPQGRKARTQQMTTRKHPYSPCHDVLSPQRYRGSSGSVPGPRIASLLHKSPTRRRALPT